ncbi:MAG: AarF/ABC1/UbiB kinase family protein [Anaerosolibacter sp.]|uniref:AarF/UbiB family protein n=1 Tax=Anaerosolibacter sp. TaxID=1872527 RepID=UPI00260B83DD|nr:AarF/ABC1/UbiB kinase family protein [Anaerosolibacter sp.]MDF2545615.1 AarF/ABC1/UbiB kinase family protein [Anaerosolibacter sp.]
MSLKRKYNLLKFLVHIMKESGADQEKLFHILGEMKGVPQKYGQFLYLVDRRKFKSFENLLDEGIPYKDQELYQRALNLTNHKIQLDKEPLASASIGQVYGGRLNDQKVIVKIQYPKIKESLTHDWKFLKSTLGFVFKFFRFPQESKDLLIRHLQEFEQIIESETNYTYEAEQLKLFQEAFQRHHQIHIPLLYSQYSSENILVEEKCSGISLKEFLSTAREEEKREILDILAGFYFDGLFRHHILHGDPHSANFFVERLDGKLTLQVIDFGCVKQYDSSFVMHFKELILCLRNESYGVVPDLLVSLGFHGEDLNSYGRALIPILDTIFEPLLVDEDFDFKYWKLTYKLNTIMGSKVFDKTMSLPKDLLILFRVFHGFMSHIYYLEEKSFNLYRYIE